MTGEHSKTQAKRTRMRGEERRAFILNRTKEVFARYGYADASTGELAGASEVTEPMLYKRCGSKKGLFLAVLSEFAAQFLETLQERISHRAEKDVLDALAHFVDDYSVAIKADPEIQRLLFQAVTESGDPDIARCVSRHNRTVYGLIRQLVERAREECYLDPTTSPDPAAWGFMIIIFPTHSPFILVFSRVVLHT